MILEATCYFCGAVNQAERRANSIMTDIPCKNCPKLNDNIEKSYTSMLWVSGKKEFELAGAGLNFYWDSWPDELMWRISFNPNCAFLWPPAPKDSNECLLRLNTLPNLTPQNLIEKTKLYLLFS